MKKEKTTKSNLHPRNLHKEGYDFDELISTVTNFKSKLLEWSQRENIELRFETIDETDRKFTAQVFLNDEPKSKGFGFSKKKAEQDAARKTYEELNIE